MQDQLNEETVMKIERRWSEYRKRSKRPGKPFEMKFKKGREIIPIEGSVDCLFLLRAGTVRLIPKSGKKPMLRMIFQGVPEKDIPVLGARYFFTRYPSSYAYVAETDCEILTADSDLIVDLGTDHERLGKEANALMRETIINSDLSESYVPPLAFELLVDCDLSSEHGLNMACEDIRAYRFPNVRDLEIKKLFLDLVDKRGERAKQLGIEASVVVEMPLASR